MKLLSVFVLVSLNSFAQQSELKKVYVNEHISTHFICSEPIQYVDISTKKVQGDLPLSNILRIKPVTKEKSELGIVTIVAQSYMVQYQMIYASTQDADKQIAIQQEGNIGLMMPEITLSHEEMLTFSKHILSKKDKKAKERVRKYGMEARLNNIYTIGDYFFVDISLKNKTNIQFDIDQFRFKIEDKKIVKSTNFQQVEIRPEFQFYKADGFKKKYRNVFVFRKFTYPNKKTFSIEVSEKQISGRNLMLKVDYKEVLKADTF
jgi:conjugative transposon TraN protein